MAEISCIVCAYNEGERLRDILSAVDGHPALKEVIVVDDGSTDGTDALLRDYPGVQVISYGRNRGKTYAMSQGVAAATGDHLMFLDADLAGLGRAEIDSLAAPIETGRAKVSISLRRNSLSLYRAIGLDFVSGERVIPAWLIRDQVEVMEALPRWGGEAFINQRIIEAGLRIEVVDWPGVSNIRKYRKTGLLQGVWAECSMVRDALRVLSPVGLVRQNLQLLRLVNRRRVVAQLRWPLDRRETSAARRAGAGPFE
ncbi:glycosyltransferase family 2 protein [Caulobacter sp. LARHSG274]